MQPSHSPGGLIELLCTQAREYFGIYDPNFMAHVYRTALEEVLSALPDAARSHPVKAFQQALTEAIQKQAYALPTLSDCTACHARKF